MRAVDDGIPRLKDTEYENENGFYQIAYIALVWVGIQKNQIIKKQMQLKYNSLIGVWLKKNCLIIKIFNFFIDRLKNSSPFSVWTILKYDKKCDLTKV